MKAALTRRRSGSAILSLLVVAIIALTGFVGSSVAGATGFPAVPAPPASPTMANQIQNLDQVKTAIKGYYGDTTSSTLDPVNGTTALHFASPTSAYANEMAGIEAKAEARLAQIAQRNGSHRAIVLDVDDTSLNTYSYEIYSGFNYSPTTNAAFVNAAIFPAVFGMPQLASDAVNEGYTLFFLTGRPESQRAGTVVNLANVGFPSVPSSQLYLKDQTQPWLSSCAPTCTTIQYKSLTRQHIESLGYTITANFGDQYSDLTGGFAQQTYKLPNPMYYLP